MTDDEHLTVGLMALMVEALEPPETHGWSCYCAMCKAATKVRKAAANLSNSLSQFRKAKTKELARMSVNAITTSTEPDRSDRCTRESE